MRKRLEDIRLAAEPPATGIVLVLLAVLSFIAVLWVITAVVRVVAG